jgi:DNA-binding NarL/FixJ family response regulator
MTRQQWQRGTTHDEIARRTGGRTRYNQVRALHALLRRLKVAKLAALGYSQRQISKELNVHRSTVCRDLQRLQEQILRPSYLLP